MAAERKPVIADPCTRIPVPELEARFALDGNWSAYMTDQRTVGIGMLIPTPG
jgi:hypothetical protein